jgi:subtilase family serine protease
LSDHIFTIKQNDKGKIMYYFNKILVLWYIVISSLTIANSVNAEIFINAEEMGKKNHQFILFKKTPGFSRSTIKSNRMNPVVSSTISLTNTSSSIHTNKPYIDPGAPIPYHSEIIKKTFSNKQFPDKSITIKTKSPPATSVLITNKICEANAQDENQLELEQSGENSSVQKCLLYKSKTDKTTEGVGKNTALLEIIKNRNDRSHNYSKNEIGIADENQNIIDTFINQIQPVSHKSDPTKSNQPDIALNAKVSTTDEEPSEMPDLKSPKIVPSSRDIFEGEPFWIEVTVSNIGNAWAGPSEVKVYLSVDDDFKIEDDTYIGKGYIGSLAPNAEEIVKFSSDMPDIGNGSYAVSIIAYVDSNNDIDESSERNLWKLQEAFTAKDPANMPDIKATYYWIKSAEADESDPFWIKVKVLNDGGSNAKSSQLKLYMSIDHDYDITDDYYMGMKSVDALDVGEYQFVQWDFDVPDVDDGEYDVSFIAYVDCNDDVQESDEGNIWRFEKILTVFDNRLPDLETPKFSKKASTVVEGEMFWATATIKNNGNKKAASSHAKLYLSTLNDFDISDDSYVGKKYVKALDPGESVDIQWEFEMPDIGDNSYNIWLVAVLDCDDEIRELSENNTWKTKDFSFTAQDPVSPPDLKGAYFWWKKTEVNEGEPYWIKVKIHNIGGASAKSSHAKLFLSSDDTFNAYEDYYLGKKAVNALNPDAYQIVQWDFEVPDLNSGTYSVSIFCVVDSDNEITESNESNPWRILNAIQVSDPPQPDLTAPTFWKKSSETNEGDTFWVREKIVNIGDGYADASFAQLYLSTDNDYDTYDDYYIGKKSVQALNPDEDVIIQWDFDIPDIGSGSYPVWLVIALDCDNHLNESDESNTWKTNDPAFVVHDLADPPDIQANHFWYQSNEIDENADFWIDVKFYNDGGQTAGKSHAKLYLSVDDDFDVTDDHYMGKKFIDAIAPDTFEKVRWQFRMPDIGTGTYPVATVVVVDCDDEVNESDENNVWKLSDSFTAEDPPEPPDLKTIYTWWKSSTATEGDAFYVRKRVVNAGDSLANTSHIQLYLSVDNDFDISDDYYVGKKSVSSLSPQADEIIEWNFTLPNLGAGTYDVWMLAVVDCDKEVQESDEQNIWKCNKSFQVYDNAAKPDLAIHDLRFQSESVQVGNLFWIITEIINMGAVGAQSSYVQLYLSTDEDSDISDDHYLGKRKVDSLASDQSQTIQWDFYMPDLANGTYPVWVIAIADSDDNIDESDEDNSYQSSAYFTARESDEPADLQAPYGWWDTDNQTDSVTEGDSFWVKQKIINAGGSQAGPSAAKLYLSIDNDFDISDDYYVGIISVNALLPDQFETPKWEFVFPDLDTGIYQVWTVIHIDCNNDVSESNEDNIWKSNNSFNAQSPTLLSDLQVTDFHLMASTAVENENVQIVLSVNNAGHAPAYENQVRLYLSMDNDTDFSDDFHVGTKTVNPLSPGDFQEMVFDFTIPDISSGHYSLWPIAIVDFNDEITELDERNIFKNNQFLTITDNLKPEITIFPTVIDFKLQNFDDQPIKKSTNRLLTKVGDYSRQNMCFDFNIPHHVNIENRNSKHYIKIDGMTNGGASGEPELPVYKMSVLLPYDIHPDTIQALLEQSEWESISGVFDIPPVRHPVPNNMAPYRISGSKKNKGIYTHDAWFPKKPVKSISFSKYYHWNIATISICPVRYKPVSKSLQILNHANVCMNFQADIKRSNRSIRLTPNHEGLFKSIMPMIENPEDRVIFYPIRKRIRSDVSGYNYVVITTEYLQQKSHVLDTFVAHKTMLGYKVGVITESSQASDSHYKSGYSTTARVKNIREWLQDHVLLWGIENVLLIGNPHPDSFDTNTSIPNSMDDSYRESPTDLCYAELSGNWDIDGDNQPGEYEDLKFNGIDRFCETAVGRIPYYGQSNALDKILQKIIDYENNNSDDIQWRNKMLIAGAISNHGPQDNDRDGFADRDESQRTFATSWTREVQQIAHSNNMSSFILLEKEGVYRDGTAYPLESADKSLNENNFLSEWKNHYGFVTWWGHGSRTGVFRRVWKNDSDYTDQITQLGTETENPIFWGSDNCPDLDDDYPSFVIHVSCNNGYPEETSNLGYALLKNGAISTVSSSRVSWYYLGEWVYGAGDNASYAYCIYDRMISEKESIGKALNACKATLNLNKSSRMWMNCLDFNLYGAPDTHYELRKQPEIKSFTIKNVGTDDLIIEALTFQNPVSYISWSGITLPFSLHSGETKDVQITIDSKSIPTGIKSQILQIRSNDPENSQEQIVIKINNTLNSDDSIQKSDFDGDYKITLFDALILLQYLSDLDIHYRITPEQHDINNDHIIGLAELIHLMVRVASKF